MTAERVEAVRREQWHRILAATVSVARDLDLAEDCVQDAFERALRSWPADGLPDNPAAWLTTVARRRVLEMRRREGTFRDKLPLLVEPERPYEDDAEPDAFRTMPDDRLRLVFTCCHPALDPDARVALTLRLVCGLASDEIARCFLVSRPTMQARITRAKRKIARARIPYRIPREDDLPERLTVVLDTVHLVYTAGYSATSGPDLVRGDLTGRAVGLARLLHELLPGEPEATGLLALLVLAEARQPARSDGSGGFVPLDEQDRSRWDAAAIAEGTSLTRRSLADGRPRRYPVLAAIAAVHAESPSWEATDWAEIVGLYDVLLELWPSPVVRLNRAVALGHRDGPEQALPVLEELRDSEPALAGYPYLPAALGRFQRELGHTDAARRSLDEAIALAGNDAEAAHLAREQATL